MKIFISLKTSWWGGGANTFAYNFVRWAKQAGHTMTRKIEEADLAIVIASTAEESQLELAKSRGVFLIHRLDEHFETNEDDYRKAKHDAIKRLNCHCDVTVYQSDFVRSNVSPHLRAKHEQVILNGGDASAFHPADKTGEWIGHVTWGVGDKKRLDLLEKAIQAHPTETFALIGNHANASIDWKRYKNVKLVGRRFRFWLPHLYRKMKVLFFPSENDPCPNTAIEAVLSGVPVAYNPIGGTKEIVKDSGLPLAEFSKLLAQLPEYRTRCLARRDLHFDRAAKQYVQLYLDHKEIRS